MILTQDNEYAVVLDACVLIPMPLCDTLLRLAEDPSMYRPLWSDQILQEVGIALEKKLGYSTAQTGYSACENERSLSRGAGVHSRLPCEIFGQDAGS